MDAITANALSALSRICPPHEPATVVSVPSSDEQPDPETAAA